MGKETRGHQQLGQQPFRDSTKQPVKAHVAVVVALVVPELLVLVVWAWVWAACGGWAWRLSLRSYRFW